MSTLSLLKRPRKTKKSKSLDDLSSHKIGTTLSDSQKSILQVAFSSKKRSCPSVYTPQMKKEGRKLLPNRCSDNNLVYMSRTPDRTLASAATGSSIDSSPTCSALVTPRTGQLRKSHSYAETLTEQKMVEHQPKKKYLKRFEKIFWPLGNGERLFNCYSCALYQDSIASGHLYLTFNWFCFYSSFIGRQRQVAIDVSRIQSITQERTAKIIPNAIKISTDSETYVFSSFISRDRAYKTLIGVWRKLEELAALSCEESDLSDVECMTQIVAMPGYTDRASPNHTRSESDSTSETSVTAADGTQRDSPQGGSPQVDISADIIQFTASPYEESNISIMAEASTSAMPTLEEEPIVVKQEDSKESLLPSYVGGGAMSVNSFIKWCCLQCSDMSESIYTILIICTALVAAMTVYLGIRLCLFENEQLSYSIRRQLQVHDTNLQLQVEATLELNRKLISQLSDILAMLQKVVTETGCVCTQHSMENGK